MKLKNLKFIYFANKEKGVVIAKFDPDSLFIAMANTGLVGEDEYFAEEYVESLAENLRGVAFCGTDDKFDLQRGMNIARLRLRMDLEVELNEVFQTLLKENQRLANELQVHLRVGKQQRGKIRGALAREYDQLAKKGVL